MKHLLFVLLTTSLLAASAAPRPVWRSADPDARSVVVPVSGGAEIRIDVLADNLFRVRRSWTNCWTESGLNRYGVLRSEWPSVKFTRLPDGVATKCAKLSVDGRSAKLRFISTISPADVAIDPSPAGKGYAISFGLEKDERIYGFGDSGRDNIMRRGHRFDIWIRNNLCNIPVPMAISRNGWGMLLNSTWRCAFDCGLKNPDALICEANEGDIDFYLFTGADYRALLDIYTRLSGRPALLPIWGYGFTFVANQDIDQFAFVNDCVHFRDKELPCDVMGLEPGWMEKFYDTSTRKEWNSKRFTFPYWAPISGHTWISALKRIGFKLSLWLCCDYDLSRYEEQCVAGLAKKGGRQVVVPDGIAETWEDDRIVGSSDSAKMSRTVHKGKMYEKLYCPEDDFEEGMLPWFEHLKKFVDQGVQCFKLDGYNQFGEHPNRKWVNGMSDEEMHNLYSVIYDKQMARGYEDYTARRAMVYSAGGYAGVQQYVATWAGDTGGGPKPLASLLNLGISGHSNQSCDMTIARTDSLHFGFLQTWSQQNNWDYWEQPWLYSPERLRIFRSYAQLRYRLLPYLYTAAAEASRTGWPVMRALALAYPDDPSYDKCMTTYMLGPDLLVSAFSETVTIPPGTWHDWRTGRSVKGPCVIPVETCEEWGGALYVRDGAVIPTWPLKMHVEKGWNEEVILEAWPSSDGVVGTGTLYEDDGISLGYREGKGALTALSCKRVGGSVEVSVGERSGDFDGMSDSRRFKVRIHVDGKVVESDLGDVGYSGAKRLVEMSAIPSVTKAKN